ncbi:MAG: PAS domain S-box protein, partial [Halobacteriota archaeon]
MVNLVLVKNEFVVAEDIASRLRAAGFDIIGTPATGKDAIAQARKLHPDVVLMDVVLKGKTDAIETAQQITERFDIPVIFLTAGAGADTIKRITASTAYGFLVKPFDDLELTAAIKMAIHRHNTEAKTRESDGSMRELTESLSEVIFETDMAGNITFINRAGLKEFGYTKKEQVEGSMTLYDFLPPDKREETRESIAQAVIDGPSEWIKVPGLRRDGSTFPVSVRASVIVREGVPVGIRGIALNVTEQNRAEQKLEESERRIREITDALPVVVYETDATGRITFVNATAFDLFGYTKEELTTTDMSLFQLIVPADMKRARAVFRRRMSGKDVGRVEYTGLRKDKSTFNIVAHSVLMKHDGAVVGQRGVILDVTELKQVEQWVKEHTHTIEILNRIMTEGNRATNVRSFAETATKLACELMHFAIGGLYLIDAEARYATLQYGLGLPETARDAIENIPCRDAPFNAILIDGVPLFAEDYVKLLPQHAPLGVASLASVPLYSQDTIIGALNVGSAIPHVFSQTEKELLVAIGNEVGTVIAKLQADEVLKRSEKRIRELTDALPVVVYETDTTGRITFVNATSLDLFGYAKEELEAGMSVFQLFAPADLERARAVFHHRLSGEDMGRVEYTGLRKDGSTFPISVRAVPLRRHGISGVRGIIVDITERRLTERALAWEAAVNLAIAHLYIPLMASTSSIADVALATLDEAKKLTGSGAGFVAHIDPENMDMVAYGRSQMIFTKPSILNTEGRVTPKERRQIRY